MFTVTAHSVSPPPRKVSLPGSASLLILPSPMPFAISGSTAASRAARRPAPAPRPPRALTQPAPGAGPPVRVADIHSAGTPRGAPQPPPALPLSASTPAAAPTPTALPIQVGIAPPRCTHQRLSAASAAWSLLSYPHRYQHPLREIGQLPIH